MVLLILLDLSSTFDTADHSSVLNLIPIQGGAPSVDLPTTFQTSLFLSEYKPFTRPLLQSHAACHMVPSQAPSYLLYTSSHKVSSSKNTMCSILDTQVASSYTCYSNVVRGTAPLLIPSINTSETWNVGWQVTIWWRNRRGGARCPKLLWGCNYSLVPNLKARSCPGTPVQLWICLLTFQLKASKVFMFLCICLCSIVRALIDFKVLYKCDFISLWRSIILLKSICVSFS